MIATPWLGDGCSWCAPGSPCPICTVADAAIIDGEGSIFVTWKRGVPYPRVQVGMNRNPALPLLEGFRERWGGSLPGAETDRIVRWVVNGEDARRFLEATRAHLRIKQPQADAALELIALRHEACAGRKQAAWSPELKERAVELGQRITALNHPYE